VLLVVPHKVHDGLVDLQLGYALPLYSLDFGGWVLKYHYDEKGTRMVSPKDRGRLDKLYQQIKES
jgi:hypothetical protein